MSAYTPGFITPAVENDYTSISGVGNSINIPSIEIREPLAVQGEALFAGGTDPDIVMQIISSTPVVITTTLTTVLADTTVVPYIPETVDTTVPPPPYVPPPTPVDPLAASASTNLLHSLVGAPVQGNLAWPTWGGYTNDVISTMELPYLDGSVVRTTPHNYGTWKETNVEYHSVATLSGDFTFEQMVASDTSFDGLAVRMGLRASDSPYQPVHYDIALYMGRNIGAREEANGLTVTTSYAGAVRVRTTSAPVDMPPALAFFHVCIERYGTVVSAYINGILVAQETQTLVYGMPGDIEVESRYLSQFRMTVGTARYQGPFTPPTAFFPDPDGGI